MTVEKGQTNKQLQQQPDKNRHIKPYRSYWYYLAVYVLYVSAMAEIRKILLKAEKRPDRPDNLFFWVTMDLHSGPGLTRGQRVLIVVR